MKAVVWAPISFLFFFYSSTVEAKVVEPYRTSISDVEEILSLKSEFAKNEAVLGKLNEVIIQLKKRQDLYKNEKDFVEYTFYLTHRKLLKDYDKYASLTETLVSGKYDCLTATAVYSIILSELDITHAVVETNYHIYILVNPDTPNELFLETTDPRNGLISDPGEIEDAKEKHLLANTTQNNALIHFDFNIERRLEGKELVGLLYYNQSIKALNSGDWSEAYNIAMQAIDYYPNERLLKLIGIINSSYSSASL
jgi:TolA-binding protein